MRKCLPIVYLLVLVLLTLQIVTFKENPEVPNKAAVFIDFETINWEADDEENNIFFIAACDGNETYPGIELCAFESASRHNPDRRVLVILSDDVTGCQPPEYFKHLTNVQFVKANFTHVFRKTPVQELWASGRVHESKFRYAHTSDLMRLSLLLKYGGAYYDSDIISLNSIPKAANFLLLEDDNFLSASLIQFEKDHYFLTDCLIAIANDFQGDSYLNHGPYAVTRIAKDYCQKMDKSLLEECRFNLTLLPVNAVSAISYPSWEIFYDPARYEEILNTLSSSFAFHYWRKMKTFQNKEYNIDPGHPLYRLSEVNCPLTTENVLRGSIGKPYGSRER